jgi:hypothetical protein
MSHKSEFDDKVNELAEQHIASQMRKDENKRLLRKIAKRTNRKFDDLVKERTADEIAALKKKWEVLLVGFPSAHGDDLILFLNGRIELEDIGLNGVGNTVNLFWVRTKAASEGFPKCGGMRGFDSNGRQKF